MLIDKYQRRAAAKVYVPVPGWLRSVVCSMLSHPIQAIWPQRPLSEILSFYSYQKFTSSLCLRKQVQLLFNPSLIYELWAFFIPCFTKYFWSCCFPFSPPCWRQWSVQAGLVSTAAAAVFRYASRGGYIFCRKGYRLNWSWYAADILAYDTWF